MTAGTASTSRPVRLPHYLTPSHHDTRSGSRISPYKLLGVLLVSGLVLLGLIACSFQRPLQGPDAGTCRGVFMSPAYARVTGFDQSHTRYASKYALYLYREQGKDPMPNDDPQEGLHLDGTPVLFIPGNAGSYKQVRSIAAEAANLFHDQHSLVEALNGNATALDFFSADFNGDFTAFHGRTLQDQAEYLNDAIRFILTLYQDNPRPARSVLLLGHSMGGIVARVMLTLPNYVDGSVNTIVTLAAPHAAAPATFDGELVSIYNHADTYWRQGFTDAKSEAYHRLHDISLLSVTGDILDNTLPADYTSLTGLVPAANGLAVSTMGVPGVWTPIDHLAIVWCSQLRYIVARTLLEVTHKNMVGRPRAEKMAVFRQNFVLGARDPVKTIPSKQTSLKIDMNMLKDSVREGGLKLPLTVPKKRSLGHPTIHMFQVPSDNTPLTFHYISSRRPSSLEDAKSHSVLLCNTVAASEANSEHYTVDFDYTTGTTSQFVELSCKDIGDSRLETIPRSYAGTSSPEISSFGAQQSPFYSMQLSAEQLRRYNSVVIVEGSRPQDTGFLLADLTPKSSSVLSLGDSSLWKLFTRGFDLTLPSHRPVIVDIDVPSARSSLLTYSFDIRYKGSAQTRFAPLLSQQIGGQKKWHINLAENPDIQTRILGMSPFCPYQNTVDNHLRLRLYADTFAAEQLVDIYMSVDWFDSLRNLVLRYRLLFVGLPVFVTCMLLLLQLCAYRQTDCFPSLGSALIRFCMPQVLLPLGFFASVLSPLLRNPLLRAVLALLDPISSASESSLRAVGGPAVTIDQYFLGIGEDSLWFYGPLALLIAFCLVCTLYGLETLIAKAVTAAVMRARSVFSANAYRRFSSNRRRVYAVIGLMCLVLFYLPYQFAFVACFFTQVFVAVKSEVLYSLERQQLQKKKDEEDEDEEETLKNALSYRNFSCSLLVLMTWILPINLPVLVVWMHNFSLRWSTPFSSHHNLLAVLPVVLFIQAVDAGYLPSSRASRSLNLCTYCLVTYFAAYALLFGMHHLFNLHHLFNILCTWMLVLLLRDWTQGQLVKEQAKLQ